MLLNTLKTSASYFEKLGSFGLPKLCRLKPIFPAVVAHEKARQIGYLLLNTLKTSVSYFENLVGYELISEARSLFRGDVGDVVLNCPEE